jgi:hypothetical protein
LLDFPLRNSSVEAALRRRVQARVPCDLWQG